MSKYPDEMNLEYKFVCADAPEVENPNLDRNKPIREQLITCKCFKHFRVFVNGEIPIPDTKMVGIFCPNCSAPASEFATLSGHSAGCFNAAVRRLRTK